ACVWIVFALECCSIFANGGCRIFDELCLRRARETGINAAAVKIEISSDHRQSNHRIQQRQRVAPSPRWPNLRPPHHYYEITRKHDERQKQCADSERECVIKLKSFAG